MIRLLRRAAELVWAAVDADDASSLRQVLGLGIDLAADEALNLLPDAIPVDGPVPLGDEPASLPRSAEQLLRRITSPCSLRPRAMNKSPNRDRGERGPASASGAA